MESTPPGAEVQLTRCGALSTKSAVTPATVWVSRRATQCRLHVRAPGYPARTVRLSRHVSRNMSGYSEVIRTFCGDIEDCNSLSDLAFVGTVSLAVAVPGVALDFATGSMFELTPSHAEIDLRYPP